MNYHCSIINGKLNQVKGSMENSNKEISFFTSLTTTKEFRSQQRVCETTMIMANNALASDISKSIGQSGRLLKNISIIY